MIKILINNLIIYFKYYLSINMAPKKKAIVEPDVNVPGIFNNILLIDGDPDVGR